MSVNRTNLLKKICAVSLVAAMLAGAGLTEVGTYINVNTAVNAVNISETAKPTVKLKTSASSKLSTEVNMTLDTYGSISKSYFYRENNNYYMIFHDTDGMHIDIYDLNYKFLSTKTVSDELNIFGGFYAGSKYNFVVYGESHAGSNEAYRVVKYDKNFNRLASLSLKGEETYTNIPFDSSTSSFTEKDNILIYYTSRLRSDGHQSNITLQINMDNMTIADELAGAAYMPQNHASHIFRQFTATDMDGSILYVNLTDRYPCCGINMNIVNANGNMTEKEFLKIELQGAEYDPLSIINITEAEVNGLGISDNSYIVTGVYKDNVFVSAINKESGKVNRTFLTDYNEYGECAIAQKSKIVQIDRNNFIVLWQTIEKGIDTVKYVKVDKDGNIKGKIKTFYNSLLSDCQPIYDNNTIHWYTIINGKNTLYNISDLDFSGTFEPLGYNRVYADKIWDGSFDTSWYKANVKSFEITTPEQLAGLAKLVNDGNNMAEKVFTIKNNLYLNADESSNVFEPIAKQSSGVEFAGTLDGKGHTIYRLYRIETDDSTEGGLFGTISKYGVVKNIKVNQSYIRQASGAIAAVNKGCIMFCDNIAKITGTISDNCNNYVGGIVGENYGVIYGCANFGRVIGYYGYAGGIVGCNNSIQGTVKCCYNAGNVSCGGYSAGGIAGCNESAATIEDCYNIGAVTGQVADFLTNYASDVGGIVGYNNDGYIVNCLSTVSIDTKNAKKNADQICAENFSGFGRKLIYNCYSLFETDYGKQLTLDEMIADDFIHTINNANDFYETRTKDVWVKDDYLPVTIAQKANELNFYKFYPTACISKYYDKISESHFGYAETSYKSSNEKIVSVDSKGNITYNGGVGKATITLTIPETAVSTEEVYTFDYSNYGIAFSEDYKKVIIGKTVQLNVDRYLKSGDSKSINYTSSDDTIATVSSSGKVTAKTTGCAKITAECGDYESVCYIYVTDNGTIMTSGKCGNNLKYTLSTDGTITFSGSGKMTSAPWRDYNMLIKSIKFSSKMTDIFRGAFAESKILTSVDIPSNIKTVGPEAFYNCISLDKLNISDGIQVIDNYAFYNTKIAEITISKSITEINYQAFGKCNLIKKIISYSDCGLDNGFDYNVAKTIECIYGIAGSSSNKFADSYNISFISINEPNFVLSVNSSNKLIINKYIGTLSTVTVPSNIDGVDVEEIDENCFINNKKITDVKLPDTVSSLPENLFKNCKSLRNVILPSKINTISKKCFYNCKSLKNITLSNTVKLIDESAFYGCESLSSFNIPAGVTEINERAFSNCKSLHNITIPDSVMSIEKFAFNDCGLLKCLVIPAKMKSMSIYALYNKSLTTLYGNSDILKDVCDKSSFLSNVSYFTIPTEKITLVDGNVSVTGYLPFDTVMKCENVNEIYTIKFINDGKEIEPCGKITVSILNNKKNMYVIEISPDNLEKMVNSSYLSGKYSFETYEKVFKLTDSIIGDTNGDGKVNIADALMIARYDAKLTTLNDAQISVSDVNGDSKVNIADALKIARYDAKLIDSLD